MGLFTHNKLIPTFESRSEAFDFMITERINKGDEYLDAVEKADRFADIIAKNKKLPSTPPKPKNGVERVVCYVEQIVAVKKEHPEVWDLVVGGIGGLVSGFALLNGKGCTQPPSADQTQDEIDFDTIK